MPRESVNPDLLELAGGAPALVARARAKADAGEAEQALHLLDIVLDVEPQQPAALALAIEVHERLLQDSVNFWLSSWLRNQIADLRVRQAGGEQ